MTSFERGDVVLAQFPYSDRNVSYRRPTLVVSPARFNHALPIAWVLMITSAENRRWPGDIDLGTRHREAGLLDPSVVRTAKISSIELRDAVRVGRVPEDILALVMTEILRTLDQAG